MPSTGFWLPFREHLSASGLPNRDPSSLLSFLIWVYARKMNALDDEYFADEDE